MRLSCVKRTLLAETCATRAQLALAVRPARATPGAPAHHLIDSDAVLAGLTGESRLIAHLPFLESLRDLGRDRAQRWLEDAGPSVGRRSSVDAGPPLRAAGGASRYGLYVAR